MSAQIDTATETPQVIDLERLLAPVDGSNPAGESLQYAGLYDEIREARRADEQLAQGEWKRENKLADWDTVIALADDALATRTKDLQIAAWYAEALVKQEGFPGLRDSLKLARLLLERFWDELYPENDEDDYEARANSFAWMDRQLAAAIKEVPLTEGTGGLRYTAHDWEDSKRFDIPEDTSNLDSTEIQKFSDLKEQAQTEGKITSEQWRVAKNTTRRTFYERTYAVLNESWSEFQALDLEMDNRFGSQTPGLGSLRKSLDEIRALIEKLVREKRLERRRRLSRFCAERNRRHFQRRDPHAPGSLRPPRRSLALLPPDRAAQPRPVPRRSRDQMGRAAAGEVARRSRQERRHHARRPRHARHQGRKQRLRLRRLEFSSNRNLFGVSLTRDFVATRTPLWFNASPAPIKT